MSTCTSEKLLEQTIKLNEKYENKAEEQAAIDLLEEVRRFRIRVPVIGKFSAGKSTLINTFLDFSTPLLAEDILPETAIPSEICYGEEDAAYLYPAHVAEPPMKMDLREFRHTPVSSESNSKVRLVLKHTKLEQIPQIDLVDMPGFDSGYQAHNRILDQYLPGSSAYLLVFSIDDAVLKENMAAVLKEIMLRGKLPPLAVVVTRAGRKTEEEQAEIVEKLTTALKKYYPGSFDIYLTERDAPESADVLLNFLQELQAQYAALQDKHYHAAVISRAERICMYLQGRLRNSALSETECEEQIQRIQEEMERLRSAVAVQKEHFRNLMPRCKDLILADVEDTLRCKKSSYVQRMIKGKPVEDKLNEDVRAAVIQGVQTHFEPELREYLSQVDARIQSAVQILAACSHGGDDLGEALKTGVGAGIVAGGATAALTSTGAITSLLSSSALTAGLAASLGASAASIAIPVIGLIVGTVTAALAFVIHKARQKERAEELGRELESSVFPKILEKLSLSIETSLEETLQKAEKAIDTEIQEKQQLLQKVLEDTQVKNDREKSARALESDQIRKDLEEMEALYHEYIGA